MINNIIAEYGTTVDNLLKKYLNILDRPHNDVDFLYNGKRIELGDEIKIETYFNDVQTGTKVTVILK